MKTAILILAAGTSSRMGKPKQLLPYKHTTLLGWAIEQAQTSKADEVVCVLGANAQDIERSIKDYKLKIIYNPNYKEGLSSSILSGIKELQHFNTTLIMLADQPNVTSSYLNKLLDASCKNPKVVIASGYGDSAGVPAVFPKKYYPELLQLKGDKGARCLLNRLTPRPIIINTSEKLEDIDTLSDYQTITSR